MGFSITWFAVPEAAADAFLERLSLVPSGEVEESTNSLISWGRMDTGWRVLWYRKYRCPFLKTDVVREISNTHEIMVCTVEEHVMDSEVILWKGGEPLWRLHHNGSNEGPTGLDVEGRPPDCFAAIRETAEREQEEAGGLEAGVDYIFEIPLRVAQSITGFKHDEDSGHVVGNQFQVLTRTKEADASSAKPGFFRRFFGG